MFDCLSDRLFYYIEPTYLLFDFSYIHCTNSCIWIFGILLKESKTNKTGSLSFGCSRSDLKVLLFANLGLCDVVARK